MSSTISTNIAPSSLPTTTNSIITTQSVPESSYPATPKVMQQTTIDANPDTTDHPKDNIATTAPQKRPVLTITYYSMKNTENADGDDNDGDGQQSSVNIWIIISSLSWAVLCVVIIVIIYYKKCRKTSDKKSILDHEDDQFEGGNVEMNTSAQNRRYVNLSKEGTDTTKV